MSARIASFRPSDSIVVSVLLQSARNRVITSAARLRSRIVRRAVSRAPSTFGGSAASIRKQVLALVTMPDRGWLISYAVFCLKKKTTALAQDRTVLSYNQDKYSTHMQRSLAPLDKTTSR